MSLSRFGYVEEENISSVDFDAIDEQVGSKRVRLTTGQDSDIDWVSGGRGPDLEMKGLKAGVGIKLSETASSITIEGSSSGSGRVIVSEWLKEQYAPLYGTVPVMTAKYGFVFLAYINSDGVQKVYMIDERPSLVSGTQEIKEIVFNFPTTEYITAMTVDDTETPFLYALTVGEINARNTVIRIALTGLFDVNVGDPGAFWVLYSPAQIFSSSTRGGTGNFLFWHNGYLYFPSKAALVTTEIFPYTLTWIRDSDKSVGALTRDLTVSPLPNVRDLVITDTYLFWVSGSILYRSTYQLDIATNQPDWDSLVTTVWHEGVYDYGGYVPTLFYEFEQPIHCSSGLSLKNTEIYTAIGDDGVIASADMNDTEGVFTLYAREIDQVIGF